MSSFNSNETCLFFFFQAEDGIRDVAVTGVQTCALPIFVTGSILAISSEEVTVWSPELIAHPTLIDRYDINSVHVRTLQNLLRWLKVDPHLRSLVSGTTQPQFDTTQHVLPRTDFNEEQNLAVERAMQMRDY